MTSSSSVAGSVLIISNHSGDSRMIKRSLGKYRVRLAQNGEQYRQALLEAAPDVIVIDHNMLDADLLTQLRDRSGFLPILLIVNDVEKLPELEVDDLLIRPLQDKYL